ncbi:MAG TPA: aldehyde dehydrogenase family protein [Pseudonocardia sp.]|jgi:aldehyde dehydrogenase (NAD+)|uniref:aldehyde dehydrogenase family protein n=1 Tax=Pseudonocardia sp. TaxID=60912 RepID=UPI002EDA3CA5
MTSLADSPQPSSTSSAPAGATRPSATEEQVAQTVARLRATFAGGRTRDPRWRLGQLAAVQKLLDESEDQIAEALASDLGRPAHDAWLGDVASSRAEASYARKHLRRWMRRRRTGMPLSMRPGRAFYQYEPLGVVLVIGPWNYPMYLTLGPLIGALAAGNCAVVKPSEHAPATSALLARLIPEYLDADAVAVLEGEAATTQALLEQGLDHAFFTGGPEIGKRVMEGAARHLTPVTLELGGKSPVIVTKDANLQVAARRIAWTKLLNSGQTCIAPDYVLVEEPVRDELVELITSTVQAFRGGEQGGLRVVNERQFDRLTGLLGTSNGRVALGGASDRGTLTVQPTVLVDPDPESPVMTEEIFGPILPVLTVASLTEAITFVNGRPKPLAAYLFSSSKESGERLLAEVSSGGAVINHLSMHCLVPQLPFGGVGNSGMGAYHGEWGFQTFSHRKAVLAKPARPDPMLMYPPYTNRAKKIIRKLF